MASSMRKLAPQLVTLSPPPTPRDAYKLLGVSEPGPTPKDVHTLSVGGLDTHGPKVLFTLEAPPPPPPPPTQEQGAHDLSGVILCRCKGLWRSLAKCTF